MPIPDDKTWNQQLETPQDFLHRIVNCVVANFYGGDLLKLQEEMDGNPDLSFHNELTKALAEMFPSEFVQESDELHTYKCETCDYTLSVVKHEDDTPFYCPNYGCNGRYLPLKYMGVEVSAV